MHVCSILLYVYTKESITCKLCSSMVVIVAHVTQCDLAQTILEACLDFISFHCSLSSLYALNTLSLPTLDKN